MKKILITILIIILLLFSYKEYKEYKRFNSPKSKYKISQLIDLNYHNKKSLYDYYSAVEDLNGFVITQWSANNIDVRFPEKDNESTRFAVSVYTKKLAQVKFQEAILEQSKKLKKNGFNNANIKSYETQGVSLKTYNTQLKNQRFKEIMLNSFIKERFKNGEKNAFIYEIQKLLIKKGYDIQLDGVYKNITLKAVKDFEEKNQLLPDGKIDELTLDALLL